MSRVSLIVHASTAQVGGAETSLLAELDGLAGEAPLFVLPAEGPLSAAVAGRGWAFRVVRWPRGLAALTQKRWYLLPLAAPGLAWYLLRLHRRFRHADRVWSSGFKSHVACMLLSPWLRRRLVYDVRDFLKPVWVRRVLGIAALVFGSRFRANSHAVGRDYPGAEVVYPLVRLARPAQNGRSRYGKRIITHLAYFAPYKGQDLFLTFARKLLDGGLDAEFWIIGDVIYPARGYAQYRDSLYGLVESMGLRNQVRFLGRVAGEEVQSLLQRTDLLLHCTREPEPFGRSVLEALLCGCEAVCHRGSGVCEVTRPSRSFTGWMEPLEGILGKDYVRVTLKPGLEAGAG